MSTTPSQRLRAKLALAFPVLQAQAGALWDGPSVRETYPAYLRTMHSVVRSAVPLMEAALERARLRAAEDEVAAGVAAYLEHHVDEERGHDGWLLEDLAATGADPGEAVAQIPSARVAELVGAQYYWLAHYHPVSLLGHVAAIEGHHPPLGFARRLQELTGYPEDAFRAIARHERLDIRHKRELYEAIDGLALRPEHESMLGISALHTMRGMVDVLSDLARRASEFPPENHKRRSKWPIESPRGERAATSSTS